MAGAEQLPCFIEEMAVSGTEQAVESYLDEGALVRRAEESGG